MEELLEDLIEEATSLSTNNEIQITTSIGGYTIVHYFSPITQSLESSRAPTVKLAVYDAIDEMQRIH